MMNYLKRRFSQGDLQGEGQDAGEMTSSNVPPTAVPTTTAATVKGVPQAPLSSSATRPTSVTGQSAGSTQSFQPLAAGSQSTHSSSTNLASSSSSSKTTIGSAQLPRKSYGPSPSAPSSPTKTLSFSAMMSAARDILSNTSISQQPQSTSGGGGRMLSRQMTLIKERTKVLFVIDDSQVDWSRYFRNRKLFNDYEIRVEQAEFKEINLASYSNNGTIVDLNVERNGTRVVRSFKPDYLLIRQPAKDIDSDWRNLLIGFKYGSIASTNSLDSIYNFRDKPWVYSQLVQIQKAHGNHAFPLINQTYYPNYREMLTSSYLPCVVKIGHASSGLGKIKVENAQDFQDVSSIVAIANTYSTCEPFVDSKYDIHIQKIGENYKAYMRKSITGSWKCTTGSAMLEQIQVTERYKFWIDQVAQIFGGLDLCSIQAVIDSEGREYIIDVNDSSFTLLGESQEGDRRQIAELVIEKMSALIQNAVTAGVSSEADATVARKPSANHQSVTGASFYSSSTNLSHDPSSHQHTAAATQSLNSSRINSPFSSTQSIRDSNITTAVSNNAVSTNSSSHLLQSNSNVSLTATGGGGSHTRHLPSTPNNNKLPSPQKPQQLPLARPTADQEQTTAALRQPPSSQSAAANPPKPSPGQRPGPSSSSSSRGGDPHPTTSGSGRPSAPRPTVSKAAGGGPGSEDSEDTMKNLRKTFAGIFGDM